jgi:hypothetical protein
MGFEGRGAGVGLDMGLDSGDGDVCFNCDNYLACTFCDTVDLTPRKSRIWREVFGIRDTWRILGVYVWRLVVA